jgi:ankyrin repeat protein
MKTKEQIMMEMLTEAVRQNDMQKVKGFLKLGIKDANLLHIAAQSDESISVAKMLIEEGMNVNARNSSDRTPLHEAARSESFKMAEMLIDAGAKFHIKNKNGLTPMDYTKSPEMKELLAKAAEKQEAKAKAEEQKRQKKEAEANAKAEAEAKKQAEAEAKIMAEVEAELMKAMIETA